MKKLQVNFNEIQKAMEDIARDSFDYFLDTETGEVIAFSEEMLKEAQSMLHLDDFDDMMDKIESIEFDEVPDLPEYMEDEVEMILEIVLDEGARYFRVPERPSSAAYESMSRFIDTVSAPALKAELTTALNGKGAFRNFKDVLVQNPKERKRWHGHDAKTMKKEIKAWLHSIGIDSGS